MKENASQGSNNTHGFESCSLRKKKMQSTLIDTMKSRHTQKSAFPKPAAMPAEKSGNTSPGPNLSGAVARARMVAIEPTTCAARRVKVTWNRVIVWRRIIPNPVVAWISLCHFLFAERGNLPTPWRESRTPSQSHSDLPRRAPATGPPAQGMYVPMLEVAHRIWAHRGAPRPTAKIGMNQACLLEKTWKTQRAAAQTTMKKNRTRRTICHTCACLLDQRYSQFRPYGADSQ